MGTVAVSGAGAAPPASACGRKRAGAGLAQPGPPRTGVRQTGRSRSARPQGASRAAGSRRAAHTSFPIQSGESFLGRSQAWQIDGPP
jgi:hypothetical protein